MTYTNNIPQPKDFLATSQIGFLGNFSSLYKAFANNHIPLDAASNAGNHTFLSLIEQPTAIQTGVSEVALYTKKVANQTDQLFFRQQGNGQEIQITNYQLYALLPSDGNVPYFTFLPGGVIMYFGTLSNVTSSPQGPFTLLKLQPNIAKNVITAHGFPVTGSNNFPCYVSLQAGPAGQKIVSVNFYEVGPNTSATIGYVVLANSVGTI